MTSAAKQSAGCARELSPGKFESVLVGSFYDFNVWTEKKKIEKLRYIHRNPVKRGLVTSPELWPWSSYRWCLSREPGPVWINDTDIMVMTIRPPAV